MQSNDKNTWFCQHFLNIFSKSCQYSFFRGKIFQSFFSAEGDKKLRTNFAGFARQKAKNSSFPWFSEKKSSSPPGTPTGSGFRQSCSKIFRLGKPVSWPSKVNGVFFWVLSILLTQLIFFSKFSLSFPIQLSLLFPADSSEIPTIIFLLQKFDKFKPSPFSQRSYILGPRQIVEKKSRYSLIQVHHSKKWNTYILLQIYMVLHHICVV